jgi:hypothetical protein
VPPADLTGLDVAEYVRKSYVKPNKVQDLNSPNLDLAGNCGGRTDERFIGSKQYDKYVLSQQVSLKTCRNLMLRNLAISLAAKRTWNLKQ